MTRRTWLAGFTLSLPLVLLSRLAGNLVPAMYGTALTVLHEAADRFLPYALFPAVVHSLFRNDTSRKESGASRRKFTAFYAGSLSLTGFAEIFHTREAPSVFVLFALPFLTVSVMLAAPAFWSRLLSASARSRKASPPASRTTQVAGKLAIRAKMSFVKPTLTEKTRVWLYFSAACLLACTVPSLFRHRQWYLAWPITLGLSALAWAIAIPGLRGTPERTN